MAVGFLKKILNGEVFFILYMFGGVYKVALEGVLPNVVDLTVIFMFLSVASAAKRLLISRRIHVLVITPAILYFGLILVTTASLFYVVINSYSIDKAFRLSTLTMWAYLGTFLLFNYQNPKQSLNRFFGAIIFLGMSVSLISLYNYFTSGVPSATVTMLGTDNYLPLGRVVAVSSILLVTYLLFFKKITLMKRLLVFISLMVFIYTLFTTGGRMPVISFALSVFTVMAFGFEFKKVKEISIRKNVLVFSYVGIWVFPIIIKLVAKSNFFSRFTSFFQADGGASANQRMHSYGIAFKMINESNLMGFGIGSYLNHIGGIGGDRSYPHNIFLELLAELGVIGLFIFILIIIVGLYRFSKSKTKRNFYSLSILAIFVYFLLNALVSGDLNDNRFLFFATALLSLTQVLSVSNRRIN